MRIWRWEHAKRMQFVPASTPIRHEPMVYQRTGPAIALDGEPRFDLTRFNPAYVVGEGGYEGLTSQQACFLPAPFTENIEAEIKRIAERALAALQP
jgi:hypothetical protein